METDHGRIVGEVAGVVVGVAASGGGAGGGAKLAPPIDVRVERVERTEASGDEEVEDGERVDVGCSLGGLMADAAIPVARASSAVMGASYGTSA